MWGIQIVWLGADDDCECFEYRQYFRAPAIRIEPPGQEPTLLRLQIGWENDPVEGWWLVEHPLNSWVEDTQAVPGVPGVVRRYGYRTDNRLRPSGEYAPDGYNYPWCYQAIDTPHLSPMGVHPPGTRYVIDVAFKGQMINTCQEELVMETEPWYWRFDGA